MLHTSHNDLNYNYIIPISFPGTVNPISGVDPRFDGDTGLPKRIVCNSGEMIDTSGKCRPFAGESGILTPISCNPGYLLDNSRKCRRVS